MTRVEFRHAGLPCLLRLNPVVGVWCGYVAVPPGHIMHGATIHMPRVRVHGGLTFAGPPDSHIYHAPEPGEPRDVWWFGFDCGHAGDALPALGYFGGVFRDVEYVRAETVRLAEQLAALC